MTCSISSLGLGLAVTLVAASAPAQGAAGAGANPQGAARADANAQGAARANAGTGNANAASTRSCPWGRSAFGADAGVLVALGSSPLVGAALKVEVGATPSLGITGRLGYFYSPSKSQYSFSDLPIWIGLRYYPGGGSKGFHAGAEFGLNEVFVRDVDYAGRPKIVTNGLFGANLPLGYRTGGFDIQVQLSMLSLLPPGGLAFGATVGYDI